MLCEDEADKALGSNSVLLFHWKNKNNAALNLLSLHVCSVSISLWAYLR